MGLIMGMDLDDLDSAYEAAIKLYNSTLDRSWCRDDFTKELENLGFNKDEAFLAFIKVRYDYKFNIKSN